MLPKRKPKEDDPAKRWRSTAHTGWMKKEFACAMCGSATNICAAHVSNGGVSGTGIKTDDFRTVPLCWGPYSNIHGQLGCHDRQHLVGEETFWEEYRQQHGQTVEQLIESLCKASPKSADIQSIMRMREHV